MIQGLGLLGIYGCAIAKSRGARLVVGLDTVPSRLEVAKCFGADLTIDVTTMDDDALVAHITTLCRPHGADVVIEVLQHAGIRLIPVVPTLWHTVECCDVGGRRLDRPMR